jgi:hypothetical protein
VEGERHGHASQPGCRPDPLGDDVPKPLFVLLRREFSSSRAQRIPYHRWDLLRAAGHLAKGNAGLGGRATQRRFGGGASKSLTSRCVDPTFDALIDELYARTDREGRFGWLVEGERHGHASQPGCRPDPLGDDVPKPLFVLLRREFSSGRP